uniref:Putative secreted protein n=1 Tax=Anopheles marajoara TaxID=58244 RepID=A0A2M4C731_9DIPT
MRSKIAAAAAAAASAIYGILSGRRDRQSGSREPNVAAGLEMSFLNEISSNVRYMGLLLCPTADCIHRKPHRNSGNAIKHHLLDDDDGFCLVCLWPNWVPVLSNLIITYTPISMVAWSRNGKYQQRVQSPRVRAHGIRTTCHSGSALDDCINQRRGFGACVI